MPFIVHWPGRVKPGTSSALVSQVDLPASLAALCGTKWSTETGPDSQNYLRAFLGDDKVGREQIVEQGGGPQTLAIRKGNWKFIPHPMGGPRKPAELYDLSTDVAETTNIAEKHPDKVKELGVLLDTIRSK